jgi:hypothetical protein
MRGYDPVKNAYHIQGIDFDAQFLHSLARPERLPGPWFRVVQVEDGLITMERMISGGRTDVGHE